MVFIYFVKRALCGKESEYKASVMNLVIFSKGGSIFFYVCLEDRFDNFINYKIFIVFYIF